MHRLIAFSFAAATVSAASAQNLHFTYLWHLEQPIYWPERQVSGADRYERAWESILRKDAGGQHPEDNLRAIFSVADRVAVYQHRVRDCIDAIDWHPRAGAQVSYSGGLIENISSLGNAGQLGYGPGWFNDLRTVRSWNTAGGKPRCDIVQFSFHHALLPLLDDEAVRKEILLYQRVYADAWGSAVPRSRGLFPSEMAFSERLIPILAGEGVQYVFVSAEKLSRACENFPVVFGSGGVNCDPPNRADQVNPAQPFYYRSSISRGCAPAEAAPFAQIPHRVQYIDPATGAASSIIVVPCAQAIGWRDGYAPLGTGDFNTLAPYGNASRPMLVVLAHDGDNAWGGGFSYYMEAAPNLVAQASSAGHTPTTVEQYLADFPVPANDLVHVEQGAWVNADGDFGAPQFLNWNWPLLNSQGQIDVPNGWHVDARNWAVITAATNRLATAEQIHRAGGGTIDLGRVLYPDASTNAVERAWHYFLGGLNSGFMYYGTAGDMEVKPTVASNRANELVAPTLANLSLDQTGPTIWAPQREPWNPGSTNFGPQYGYQQRQNNGDFYIWTFAHDVSGITSVTLKYRLDADGVNPLASTQNETFAGGPEVGAWQSLPMTRRVFPANNVYNDPSIDFFVMPSAIADEYYVQLTGIRSALLDYYIEALDSRGNVKRSPIDHVYIGAGSPPQGSVVTAAPNPPVAGQNVTITYDPAGRNLAGAPQVFLHYGFNSWSPVVSPDPAMTLNGSVWQITVPVIGSATQLDVVFNNGAGTWDNNSGQDWHFQVSGGQQPTWVMDGQRDAASVLVAENNGAHLWTGLQGTVLYVATENAGAARDHFILLADVPGALRSAMWAKAGQVAAWDAFLGAEGDNTYSGWTDAPAGSPSVRGAVLEGTIDLLAELGPLPEFVYLAAARYATADGGALVSSLQVPASVNGNGNIDSAEYVRVRLCDLTVAGCPPACDPDVNCDGAVNGFDVEATEQAVNGDFSNFCQASADLNGDGAENGFDIEAEEARVNGTPC